MNNKLRFIALALTLMSESISFSQTNNWEKVASNLIKSSSIFKYKDFNFNIKPTPFTGEIEFWREIGDTSYYITYFCNPIDSNKKCILSYNVIKYVDSCNNINFKRYDSLDVLMYHYTTTKDDSNTFYFIFGYYRFLYENKYMHKQEACEYLNNKNQLDSEQNSRGKIFIYPN